jgi:serine protease Do
VQHPSTQTCHKGTSMRATGRLGPTPRVSWLRPGARGISQMDKTRIPRRALLVAAGLAFTSIPLQAETFTGTAFAVSEEGDLVTNEHVISGCSGHQYGNSLTVRQGKVRTGGAVRVSDKSLDLAVVRFSPTSFGTASKLRAIAALRDSPPLRVGEQAISYGFPLIGALATEGNLTVGNVSALHGLGDDPHYIQITTPVQPGNSGGPLLDSGGNIIGVVAAKLNALGFMRATGDIPQNVNFAVELGTLKGVPCCE